MNIEEMLEKNKNRVVVAILAIIILFPIGYYAVRDAFPKSPEPFLEKPDPKYEKCVRDVVYMRFHHMDLLKEIRVQVVREGKRSDIRLKDCRQCHANRSRFCNECHNKVNLHLDCFGCHNYPESPQQAMAAKLPGSSLRAVPNLSEDAPEWRKAKE